MEYGLTRHVLESRHFLPITEEEYQAIATAKRGIMVALKMEERFNLVLENFLEFEHEMLQITWEHSLRRSDDWSGLMDPIYRLNRRLVNLLATTRMFLEHGNRDVCSVFGEDSPEVQSFKAKASAEYDSRVGYRMMEALRNHALHRGLPLKSLSIGWAWQETELGRRRVHSIALHLDVDELRADAKFKASVRPDLSGDARGQMQLKPLVREYITGLFAVQADVRDNLSEQIQEGEDLLRETMLRWQREAEMDLIGLAAVVRRQPGEGSSRYEGEIDIFPDYMERRAWLAKRNHGAGDLSNLIISSE